MEAFDEELHVLCHACGLGRSDVASKAIATIKSNLLAEGSSTPDVDNEVATIISGCFGEDNLSALHIATLKGHGDCVRTLLQAKASLTCSPSSGKYANLKPYNIASESTKKIYNVFLFEQVAIGNVDTVSRLLDGGIDPNIEDDFMKSEKLIHWACGFGNIDIVREIIAHGAELNPLNSNGGTPLHVAAKSGFVSLVKELLLAGADIEIRDNLGKKAMEYISVEDGVNLFSSSSDTTHEEEDIRACDIGLETVSNCQSCIDTLPNNDEAPIVIAGDVIESVVMDNVECAYQEKLKTDCEYDPIPTPIKLWPLPKLIRSYNRNKFWTMTNTKSVHFHTLGSHEFSDDIHSLLNWSGVLDEFDRHSINVQIKNHRDVVNTGNECSACIRVEVNEATCPGISRYELTIRADYILVRGSDDQGLFYGLQTLKNWIRYYSEVIHPTEDETLLRIHLVDIYDWPDSFLRSVMWSGRGRAQLTSISMKENIEFLSKNRVNRLYFLLDNLLEPEPGQSPKMVSSSRIYSIAEVCKKFRVDLIPTFVVASISEQIQIDTITSVSSNKIGLILALEPNDVAMSAIEGYLVNCMNIISQNGVKSVLLTTFSWVVDHIDPLSICSSWGISCSVSLMHESLPNAVFSMGLISVDHFCPPNSLEKTYGSQKLIIPGFMDDSFLFPTAITKIKLMLYCGELWSHRTDGTNFDHESLPEEVVMDFLSGSLITTTRSTVLDTRLEEIELKTCSILTTILSKEWENLFNIVGLLPGDIISKEELRQVEEFLWAFVLLSSEKVDLTLPSKGLFVKALKLYRSILAFVGYKIRKLDRNDSEVPSFLGFGFFKPKNHNVSALDTSLESLAVETEEILLLISMYTLLCRLVISGYNVLEKSQASITVQSVLDNLTTSSRSDMANTLLQIIQNYRVVWNVKFDTLQPTNGFSNPMNKVAPRSSIDQQLVLADCIRVDSDDLIHQQSHYSLDFLRSLLKMRIVDSSTDPRSSLESLFRGVVHNLNLPKAVEDIIASVFI